jgi:hypothetical protein
MREVMSHIIDFLADEDATLSVEAVIILPIMLWAYAAMYVFWDAFKMQNINVKSAYTIADMMSREPVAVTPDYIDGLAAMLDFLNRGRYETRLRVSVVGARVDPADGSTEYFLCWSEGRGMDDLTSVASIESQIPVMPPGGDVIIVETEMDYVPLLNGPYGIESRTFTNFIPTRPRPNGRQAGLDTGGSVQNCLNPEVFS